MQVDIATHTSWKDLQQLRRHILDGTETTSVKYVKKLLMKGLADAIAAENWRRDAKNGGVAGNGLIVTIDLRVGPSGHKSSGPEKAHRGISLIAQLDDALTKKKKTRKDLLSW
ncbi:hypothetical protein [Paraburkholderia sp. RL17-337-BIB-A]|uniref:hypothetical protein n=1 Tax=Paraburkholderia sp. RL17-337-BIB-A TaxID=3031636 RepID=UPI0038BB369E